LVRTWDGVSMDELIEIDGVRLTLTCDACPEQYEAFQSGKRVGFLAVEAWTFQG
jgi:hypothetical protein